MFLQKAVNRGLKLDFSVEDPPPPFINRTTRSPGGIRNQDLKTCFLVDLYKHLVPCRALRFSVLRAARTKSENEPPVMMSHMTRMIKAGTIHACRLYSPLFILL